MRKKVFYLLLIALPFSLLTTYIFGVLTPGIAAAETVKQSIITSQDNNPDGISPQAAPVKNLWGASKSKDTVECTFNQSEGLIGWRWSRPNPLPYQGFSYIQPIYPNARITLKSPVTLGDIQSFILFTDFQYTQPPTGGYSLVYDIFLREPGTNTQKVELMIILDRTQPHPVSPVEGAYSDGCNTYQLYSWTRIDGCALRSFRMQLPAEAIPYQVNLKALLDLIETDSSWYISEVMLGTEVWDGSGAVELSTYYLELNGDRL